VNDIREQIETILSPAIDARAPYARVMITMITELVLSNSGWQPIETAPVAEMFIYYQPREGRRCIGLAYRTADGEWRDSEGNWSVRLEPTHWMPLPEPPK
jgi:hypothetical protein